MLNHNGGVIARTEPLQMIRQENFELSLIAPILDYCRSAGVHFDLCTAFSLYCETLSPYEKEMYDAFLLTPVMVANVLSVQEPPVKLTLFGPEPVMDAAERFCQTISHPLRMIRSDRRFIDFMLPGVNKGSALAALCARYGIAASEVLAIGNYFNDQEMIAFAGVGVAMANSPDALKVAADDVTHSNNEEGVYYAIQKYMFQ
jgi:hydroxymethylpyrimidine pyrophosphatase-like HAD family hydrolase